MERRILKPLWVSCFPSISLIKISNEFLSKVWWWYQRNAILWWSTRENEKNSEVHEWSFFFAKAPRWEQYSWAMYMVYVILRLCMLIKVRRSLSVLFLMSKCRWRRIALVSWLVSHLSHSKIFILGVELPAISLNLTGGHAGIQLIWGGFPNNIW